MNDPFSSLFGNLIDDEMNKLKNYTKLDNELQLTTGLDLQTLIIIARTHPLFIKINEETISLYDIIESIKKTGVNIQYIFDLLRNNKNRKSLNLKK